MANEDLFLYITCPKTLGYYSQVFRLTAKLKVSWWQTSGFTQTDLIQDVAIQLVKMVEWYFGSCDHEDVTLFGVAFHPPSVGPCFQ